MTPEQVDRTIEFILQHQSHVAAQLEELTAGFRTGQAQTRDVQTAILILSDLAQIQSGRLDRHEEEFKALLKHYNEGQKEALHRLDEILRRLTEKN